MVMKRHLKKIALGTFMLALGAAAYLNFQLSKPAEPLSDLTLANIEALSYSKEGDSYNPCYPPYSYVCEYFVEHGIVVGEIPGVLFK